MKRSVLILSFLAIFLVGTIATSPDIAKAAEGGWQVSIEEILAVLNQDQFQLDIVTTCDCGQNKTNISILLRNDNNKYFRTNISPDMSPDKVNIADVNNDGHQDIVTVGRQFEPSPTTDMISVLLGNGDGTFQTEKLSPTDGSPNQKKTSAIADFNEDGFLDFMTVDRNEIVLHLGDGTGMFGGRMSEIFPNISNTGFVVADVDNDGHQDVVGGSVGIVYGIGDGTFEAHEKIGLVPGSVESIAVADMDNDGTQDVVVVTERHRDPTINSVSILYGDPLNSRTFDPAISIKLDNNPNWVEVGDFNNDGNQDVVVANRFIEILVLFGNGDKTFLQGQFFGGTNGSDVVLVEDINNDGNQDIVTLNYNTDIVSVLFGDGQGHFDPKVNDYRVRDQSSSMAIGDFKTLP